MDKSQNIKFILKNRDKLSIEQQLEVYKIIKEHQINHTKNKNGVFINLEELSDNRISEIFNYINFSILTNNKLKKRNKKNLKKKYAIQKKNIIELNKTPAIKINNDKFITDDKISLKKNKKKYNLSQKKIIKNYKTVRNKVMLPLALSKNVSDDEEHSDNDEYLEDSI
uniref:NET domain-containing protein n=1 Tax=viral metagenome TaxID=1070528 RepID=A0A6C0JA67_9ZZZZ